MTDVRNDDEDTITMLRRLDDEPDGPGRIDLAGAMAEARRRRRIRLMTGAGGVAVLAVAMVAAVPMSLPVIRPAPPTGGTAVATATAGPGGSADPTGAAGVGPTSPPPAPAPPTGCTVHQLAVPGDDPQSLVTGADPTGRFVLGRSYPPGEKLGYPAVIWDDGKPERLKLPGDDQTLSDVNSAGVVVGYARTDDRPIPYLYRDGRADVLPGVRWGQALAINEANQIVGFQGHERDQPVIWPGPSSPAVSLPLPDDASLGRAVDIDETGTVLGVLQHQKDATESGYLWRPDGTGARLPTPMVAGVPATSFRPQSIRNGWVIGVATLSKAGGKPGLRGPGDITVAVRLHVPTGRFVELSPNTLRPQTGNGHGWIVGAIGDRVALLTDAGPLFLPNLRQQQRSTPASSAVTLSDDGRIIAGQSDDAKGNPQAVIWRCR